jgi:hypothetical protein
MRSEQLQDYGILDALDSRRRDIEDEQRKADKKEFSF